MGAGRRARAVAPCQFARDAGLRRQDEAGESACGDVAAAAYDAVEDMSESNPGDVLLVTGASGFVGSAIANAAREAGYRVRVLVRASSPRTNIAPWQPVYVVVTPAGIACRATPSPAS